MRWIAQIAAIVAALLSVQPALAAPPEPETGAEIVIEAQQRHALRAFVDALAQAGPTEQLGRWKDEICPAVAGIDPAEAAMVEDRIAEVAKWVDLRREGRKCVPTLIVIVTPAPQKLADEIAKDFPRDDGMWRIHRFLTSDRPVRWLTVTNECGGKCGMANSRLVMATSPTFAGLLILVDANRLTGFKLGELADYVALVGLSNPKQGAGAPSSSILSMFEKVRAPGEQFAITDRDRAFLAGLYRTQIHTSAQAQEGTIENYMKHELRRPKPPPPSNAIPPPH